METPMEPTLQAALDAVTGNIPPTVEAMIAAGIERVAAGGPHGLDIGTPAPHFTLPDAEGRQVDLASSLESGPVVLTFYRGDWCPFCNLELRALQSKLAALDALGATVLAISPQAPDRGVQLTASAGLGFAVLSDVDQSVSASYNLVYTIDADSRDLFENVFHNDIAGHNADGTWRLPIPATFVLDRDGIIRSRFVDPDYRRRMEPADIVAAVERVVGER